MIFKTHERHVRTLWQYSDGVTPSCFLNIRLKCWGYSKPRRSDTWEMVYPAASPFLASWMTNWRMWLLAVSPVVFLMTSPK